MSPEQRLKRLRNTPPYRFPHSTDEMLAWLGKGLTLPKDGWNAQEFAVHGKELMMTVYRMANLTTKKAVPHLAKILKSTLDHQVELVIGRTQKNVSLWLEAIEEVFREHNLDVQLEVGPIFQSVASQGYSKTSAVLVQSARPEANTRITQMTREIGDKITRVNDTTRRQIIQVVEKAVENGSTVAETAQEIREKLPALNANRALVIARTELANAWAQGSALAYLESDTLTHVSVIGCESREEDRWGSPSYPWLWRGQSTCNAREIAIHDLEAFLQVGWHPNHTGCLTPSGFR